MSNLDTATSEARVLVVDDAPPFRRALATNLRARGYQVDLAATGDEALHWRPSTGRSWSSSTLGCPASRRRGD